jgi:hypothetical protein
VSERFWESWKRLWVECGGVGVETRANGGGHQEDQLNVVPNASKTSNAGLGHLDRYWHTCVHLFHSPVYLKRAMATTFSATKQQPTLLQPWLYKPFASE